MKVFPVYLGFGVVVLIGLGIFSLGARNLWRAVASTHWPTVPATVVESSTQVSGGSRNSMYTANLKFQYEVNGHSYGTDQIYIGQTVGSGDASETELRRLRYPMGDRVTVFYDPSDPSIASVHPGFQAEVLWLPGAGLAFLVPTLMAFVLFRSSFEGTSGMGVGLAIFSLVFMTVGCIILFFGGRALWRGWQSPDWPTTRGTIVFNRRDASQSTTRTSDDGGHGSAAYGARLIFRFEVDGRAHFSNTRRFGQLSGSDEEWADRIAGRYPLGSEVNVWYRRDAPDLATLEPGVSNEALWLPGAGAAFLLFGVAALLLVPRL
jgi:hypothetical protein